jgi:penicillin amidase
MKKSKILWPIILILLLTIIIGSRLFLRASLAPMDSSLHLDNFSAPVTVKRDHYGIPHIYAKTKTDGLRALGFVMASERLFQMEIQRRFTQGTLSEIFGDVALKSDKLYHNLMLRESIERMIKEQKESGTFNTKMWNEMLAYCDGINQYINTQHLPYEFTLLGIKPQPFTPMDSMIVLGYMAYSFEIGTKADVIMTKLSQSLSPEKFKELRNYPPEASSPEAPKEKRKHALHLLAPLLETAGPDFVPAFEGSNSWLVGPQKSESGKSIFANDPHIAYSNPAVWFEAHIKTPEFELYGHYLPTVPFAILGHNKNLAWGFTMSLNDDMDLYKEKINHNTKQVMFNNAWTSYKEHPQVIHVKNKPDVEFTVIETAHGPVLDEVLDEKDIALRWSFHKETNNPMENIYSMGEASNISEFENALKTGNAPGLNVMYADADNIAWWTFGDIIKRKNPNSDMILDGASGADEYIEDLPWEHKPHLLNPPEGFIVTANSRPSALDKNIRGDWQSDDRMQTITRELLKKERFNVNDFKALQTKNYNYKTPEILNALISNLKIPEQTPQVYQFNVDRLKAWNQQSTTDSTAAALYHQWNNENILLMLAELSEDDRAAYLNTPYAWLFYERTILNPNSAWWKNKSMQDLITEGYKKAALKLTDGKNWGHLHTIEYVHPLGMKTPLNYIFNVGPYPIPGAFNEINNNKMKALGGDFKVVAGPSTRRIIDFANPEKSLGINPIGQSGHILSDYNRDQVKMFIQGEYRPQLMNDDDINKDETHELTIQ